VAVLPICTSLQVMYIGVNTRVNACLHACMVTILVTRSLCRLGYCRRMLHACIGTTRRSGVPPH